MLRGQKGYKALGTLRLLKGVGGHLEVSGASGGVGVVRGVLGASRDFRNSGPEMV